MNFTFYSSNDQRAKKPLKIAGVRYFAGQIPFLLLKLQCQNAEGMMSKMQVDCNKWKRLNKDARDVSGNNE